MINATLQIMFLNMTMTTTIMRVDVAIFASLGPRHHDDLAYVFTHRCIFINFRNTAPTWMICYTMDSHRCRAISCAMDRDITKKKLNHLYYPNDTTTHPALHNTGKLGSRWGITLRRLTIGLLVGVYVVTLGSESFES